MSGEHIVDDELAGLAALPERDTERQRAEAHARSCARCGPVWREAVETMSMLGALEELEPPSHAALSRARAAVLAELRAEPTPELSEPRAAPPAISPAVAGGAAIATLLLAVGVALLHGALPPIEESGAVLAAMVLASLLVGSSALARGRLAVLALALAVIGSITAASIEAHDSAQIAIGGGACMLIELATAAGPLALTAWAFARRRVEASPAVLAAVAAAGALAAQLALTITCEHPPTVAHLGLFHVGGVLLAALLASALSRVRPLRGAA